MAATFASTVLGQPTIAAMVFELQFGMYEDVRSAFRACDELVEFNNTGAQYKFDVMFAKTFTSSDTAWERPGPFHGHLYGLHCRQRDHRLPLHMAIAAGSMHLTKRMLGCRPDLASNDAILVALSKNRLEIAEWLLDHRAMQPKLYQRTDLNEHDHRLRCVYNALDSILPVVLTRDDTKGLELLQRFGPCPDGMDHGALRRAAYIATRENLTLALDVFPWFHDPHLMDDIAGRGFLSLVQSLHERHFECSTYAMDNAAASGHLEVVRFLQVHRTEGCTASALNSAICHGQLDVVRFLLKHRTEVASPYSLESAAGRGHLDVVQYLHSLGTFACTALAIEDAAEAGHLEVVKFLLAHRNEGCRRDRVVAKALEGGSLRVAEYLMSLGYPLVTSGILWSEGCDVFRKPDMVGVLRLLVAHGEPWDEFWLLEACDCNNVALVQFIHANSDAMCHPENLARAIENEAWAIVDYLLAHCTVDISDESLQAALRGGRVDLATRLLERQPELGRNGSLLLNALKGQHVEVMRYLLAAGIGNPAECLVDVVGRRNYVTASKLLLPYCMDPTNPLQNMIFLLRVIALPDRRRKTTLQVIAPELTYQGKVLSLSVQLAPSVALRATTLFEADEVVDWALALVVGHLWGTDETVSTEDLTKWTAMVENTELKSQLTRLLAGKRKLSSEDQG
ncbi:hypothetical protein SPRG_06518 [Saprolegnia parasitica CBS 223.65]|uniref:Uncharacterized protein n=1 Tax=Saprolegnia parasitica (strain CBS 223.65) TaxID=695850 RepID=A0A067CDV3_SAPPC|nr:hypothetical protein SPRG_06518 [Saprolegnia parasitica CBS 223.65]KDO28663.1 hypothetical protein SPRG_06518 [Saprolegnia parasitica CBS 223.65]|eukprot:XP_012200723.1 hypothetical protein SPRG_06518 [Saprolegnia parasitica CBS 223.65]